MGDDDTYNLHFTLSSCIYLLVLIVGHCRGPLLNQRVTFLWRLEIPTSMYQAFKLLTHQSTIHVHGENGGRDNLKQSSKIITMKQADMKGKHSAG